MYLMAFTENPQRQEIPDTESEEHAPSDEGCEVATKEIQKVEQTWNELSEEDRTYDAYDAMIRKLYQRCAQAEDRDAEEYTNAVRKHEKVLREKWGSTMPQMLEERVASMKMLVTKETASSAQKILPALQRFGVDVSNFSIENDGLLYKKTSGQGEEKWKISINESGMTVLRNENNPGAMLSMEFQNFLKAIENSEVEKLLDTANNNAKNEQEGQEILRAFDIPPNENVTHLRVLPKRSGDDLAPANLSTAAFISSALQKRYGNRMKIAPLVISDNPMKEIRENIRREFANGNGSKIFVIDIFEHGTEDQIDFVSPIKASDLAALGKEFTECQFQINTLACHGGGLRNGFQEEFAKDPALAKRMNIFLQTKPSLVNYGGRIENNGKKMQWSSPYYAHLAAGLYAGKTYGEAAADADQAVKEFSPQDAEAIINGKLIAKAEEQDKQYGLL